MIHQFSERIVDNLVADGYIPFQNREWCVYILETRLSMFIGVSCLLLLGTLFEALFQAVAFLVSFWSVRMRAGGYHSSTPNRCFVLSAIVFSMCMFLGDRIAYDSSLQWSFLIFSNLILLRAPINSASLNLSEEEYMYNKKTLRRIQCVNTVIIALLLFNNSVLSAHIVLGYAAASLSVAVAKIQEYIGGKTSNERVDESVCR